jgi:sugar/nucleoside kinase (ribokinase family)
MIDICGLGTLAADILMKVDRLPGKDDFGIVQSTDSQPGGSGTNVAVQAARLGSRCAYIGCTGDDEPGKVVRDSLVKEKIDIDGMQVLTGGVTTHTDIVVDKEGQKFILLTMGDAFFSLTLSEQDRLRIRNSRVFFTDLLPGPAAGEGLREARRGGAASAAGMEVDLDTMKALGVSREQIEREIAMADVFAPCRAGLYQLTGRENPGEAASVIRKNFGGILLLTRGSQGSLAYLPDGTCVSVSACPVEAVDTTGAGDSYMGAFMHAFMVQHRPLRESMEFASYRAALTCTGLGSRYCPPDIGEEKK